MEKPKKTISYLHQEKEKLATAVTCLEEEVSLITSKLQGITKTSGMLNKGLDMLDPIVEDGKKFMLKAGAKLLEDIHVEWKTSINLIAIGFNYKFMNKKGHMFQHRPRRAHP